MSLEELLNVEVTSATISPSSLKTVPATIITLSAQQIRQRGYQSLEDFIRDLPGIDLVDLQGTFPLVWAPRGSYGDENKRTLLLIDGVVENNILEGNVLGGPQYSLHNVERIEFLWGPASALYGANAMSGVINIVTRKGRDIDGGEVQVIAGSFDTQAIKLLAGSKIDDFEYSFSASLYSSGGPVFSERHPDYSSSYVDDAYSVVARLNYKDLGFGYHRYDRPMGYGQFFNSANEAFGLPLFGYQDSEGQAIDNSLSPVDLNGQKGTLWHSVTETAFVDFKQPLEKVLLKQRFYYRNSEIADDSYAYTWLQDEWAFIPYTHFSELAGLQFQLDYQLTDTDKLILGMDYERRNVEKGYRERFEIQESPLVLGLGGDRVKTNYINESLFAQYQFISAYLSETSFTFGARYDNNNVYGSTFNPRLGMVVPIADDKTLKASLATAYRAPNSFDLFAETTVRIANPDLKPEKSRNFELNFGYQASENIYLESIYFYNRLSDMIVSNVAIGDIDNDGAIETQNRNLGEADLVGIELRSKLSVDRKIKVSLNLSYQDTKFNDDLLQDGDIPNTADVKANITVDWRVGENTSVFFASRYVGERSTAITNPRNSVESYFVSDVAWSYDLSSSKNMNLTLRINNIFDNDYYDPGLRSADGLTFPTQYEYPGINGVLKLSFAF